MKADDRSALLKLVAFGGFGLLLLDYAVAEPFLRGWHDQGERITELRQKVDKGQALVDREKSIRAQWAGMLRANLPEDNSIAQDQAYKAVSRWVADSGSTLANLGFPPVWQTHDEGSETIECRVAVNGDQVSLGKFIYNLETDRIPVNLEECEVSTRDLARGAVLNLTARFTFMRLSPAAITVATHTAGRETP